MPESLEGLLEGARRLAERRAIIGLRAGLLAVGHRFVPDLAAPSMVRQAFDLLSHPVRYERLKGLDNARVEPPPPLQQEAAVRHLVRQGVREGELALGKQAGLIQEFGRLQVGETAVQLGLGQLGNGLQQWECHFMASDRSGLEEALVLGR